MSNYHLRDMSISLKAKGLLSQMLSLPEEWDYTLSGLAHINKESKDAIRSAVNELEKAGYIRRRQTRSENGGFATNEYVIYEQPMLDAPSSETPTTDSPSTKNPAQINIDQTNKDQSITDSFPSSTPPATDHEEPKRRETTSEQEMREYRSIIQENIDYDSMTDERPDSVELIDEVVELMTETVCSKRKTIRVAGESLPAAMVRSRFLKLNGDHIRFVLDCMQENTTKIRNIRQYLLTVLFNAPSTIGSYYSAKVNHDLAQLSQRR